MKWFANKGQIIQVICAVVGVLLVLWQRMSQSSPWVWVLGAVLIVVAVALFVAAWRRRVTLAIAEIYDEQQPEAAYKLKLRIMLRNDSRFILELRKPRWLRKSESDLFPQTPLGSSFELEEAEQGLRRWSRETEVAVVRPGQRCRVWVGMDATKCSPADLKTRIETKLQLGTLEFPVNAAGRDCKLEVRVQTP